MCGALIFPVCQTTHLVQVRGHPAEWEGRRSGQCAVRAHRVAHESPALQHGPASVQGAGVARPARGPWLQEGIIRHRYVYLLSICIWKAFSNTFFWMYFHLYFEDSLKKYFYLYFQHLLPSFRKFLKIWFRTFLYINRQKKKIFF